MNSPLKRWELAQVKDEAEELSTPTLAKPGKGKAPARS
jgi:hypothetical protein